MSNTADDGSADDVDCDNTSGVVGTVNVTGTCVGDSVAMGVTGNAASNPYNSS